VTDSLRRNANLVEMLGGALRDGGHALGSVPSLLKQLLTDDGWREFVTQRGEHVVHERFADFVTTPPLAGLGTTVTTVRKLLVDDMEALDLLDRAVQNRPSIHAGNNIPGRPEGTSKDKALRRLRKDAPDLHAEVLAGNLAAHTAMVKAGFRPKTFTVRADRPASIAATLRRQLDPEALAELARLLTHGEDQ
jgi:hypothetical protein